MNPAPSPAPRQANRLAREKSPYLLQHQFNPVDWFPWGEEAFQRARTEEKPIFLSIGYATCHWCHVMERETFENVEAAAFLNQHFVSIKVDREERPDVDRIYMAFVQATTGQGGWPLNVFLTAELKPFFGGTYFPPDNRHGRPSFLLLLRQLNQAWETQRSDIFKSAGHIYEQLQALARQDQPGTELPDATVLTRAAEFLKGLYDPEHGGFGSAPKFPQPSQPQLLLRHAARAGDAAARQMVLHTCDRMADGGIHDQLGGGFSRYSVDAAWLVPHFEKMLYDNAQLAQLYLDAYRVSGDERYARVVRQTLDYVRRDLTDSQGGFFSAEDADSEGHEGKFYCWTTAELEQLLNPGEYQVAARYFGLAEAGNFMDHSHPEPLPNQNVLSVVDPALDEREAELLRSAKAKMLAIRERRVRPLLDDKVLASWNGLMLGAMARASAVLADDGYLAAAEKNATFLRQALWDEEKRVLYHRWREGGRDTVQLLTGYAFLLSGVLDLYEAALDPAQLDFAIALAEAMLDKFYDEPKGGFWPGDPAATDLIFHAKDDHDGAEPSGNSVAVLALLRLGKITGRERFTEAGLKTLKFYRQRLEAQPQALPAMLHALEFALQEPERVVMTGAREQPAFLRLLRETHRSYAPNRVILGNTGAVEPFARTLPDAARPRAYVCVGETCLPPREG